MLPWLEPPPADFRPRCEAVDLIDGDRTEAIASLASFDLNESQLLAVYRRLRKAQGRTSRFSAFRLGLLSNATTDFLVPALCATAARYRIQLDLVVPPFGQTLQAALAPDTGPSLAASDAVLLALDFRAYFPELVLHDADPEVAVNRALRQLRDLIAALRTHGQPAIIVQSIAPPPERLFGSFDRFQPGTSTWLAARFNHRLTEEIVGTGICLMDAEGLANQVGLASWHDRGQHLMARLPFAGAHVPLYAEHVLRLIAALRGKTRKVLVLDLDNTIWGGVIGDDGIEGISLGQGDARSEAFLDVQRTALALKQRGILLAVCSKNTESIALDAIRKHPEMLLRVEDFSAIQINWRDKATNLEAIARQLSLGIDSLVLLDDNPTERAQVRQALPMVAVPELPSDPAAYARILTSAGYFEAVSFSAEDRERSAQYAANAQREALLSESRNLGDFLRSLQMQAEFTIDGSAGWSRFAQLINKSNQFNLTTRRYTEAELQPLIASDGVLTMQVRLRDRFGDNGMISAIIATPRGTDWMIDTWVMSCRVLGRDVEKAVLNRIVAEARRRGITRLVGIYRATERNGIVKSHYAKLGFSAADPNTTEERWELDVALYHDHEVPIDVVAEFPA